LAPSWLTFASTSGADDYLAPALGRQASTISAFESRRSSATCKGRLTGLGARVGYALFSIACTRALSQSTSFITQVDTSLLSPPWIDTLYLSRVEILAKLIVASATARHAPCTT